MNNLDLIMPGLIWPEVDDLEYILHGAKLDAISEIMAKSKKSRYDFSYSDLVYSPDFYDKELSLAENHAKKLGLPLEHNYMLLEPTNLRADRDRLLIAESDILQLNESESFYLLNALNQHFNPDNIYFNYISEHLWLVQLPFTVKHFKTYPIIDIIGCNIDEYLPSGNNYLLLHRILNEIQMLFHNLELDIKRQEDGLVAVNSVWFWDKKYNPLPSEVLDFVKPKDSKFLNELELLNMKSAILLDKAYFSVCYRDSFAWLESINQLNHCIGSVLRLLQSGKIKQLKIWLPDHNGALMMQIRRLDLYKFWKKGDYKQLVIDFK